MSAELKRFSVLAEFTDDDREALVELLEERTVWEGRAIFRENEEAEGLVLLVSGEAQMESKRGVELGVVGPGACLGGISLMVLGKRECTALAKSQCTVLVLPRTSFRRLVDDAPRAACRLCEAVMAEFASAVREGLDGFSSSS